MYWTQGFPCDSVSKESVCNTGDPGLIPGLGRSLEKEMATHFSILAWRIPWAEEPGRLQSIGPQESDMTEWLNYHHIEKTSLPLFFMWCMMWFLLWYLRSTPEWKWTLFLSPQCPFLFFWQQAWFSSWILCSRGLWSGWGFPNTLSQGGGKDTGLNQPVIVLFPGA